MATMITEKEMREIMDLEALMEEAYGMEDMLSDYEARMRREYPQTKSIDQRVREHNEYAALNGGMFMTKAAFIEARI